MVDHTDDVVVLLDEDAKPVGTAPRASVHGRHTPLHLAFSCYLFDAAGRVLMTRRSVAKKTWPGVWTNSFCGHPRPGEAAEEAVARHARHELGIDVRDVRCVLPRFRYHAVDASGVEENEVCPVFVATFATEAGAIDANPDEVAEWRWLTTGELSSAVAAAPWALSPWLLEQHAQVQRLDRWTVGPR